MLEETEINQKTVWEIVKKIRILFLSKHADIECDSRKITLPGRVYKKIIKNATHPF